LIVKRILTTLIVGALLGVFILEEKRARLKLLAKARQVSVTKLIEEMATVLIADFDAETRFELRAARGLANLLGERRYKTRRAVNALLQIRGRRAGNLLTHCKC
jgi:hypothetical protein